MGLKTSAFVERLRASLFFIPMVAVVAAVVAALGSLALDRQVSSNSSLPLGMTSTVESARSVLSTVAGATISFAGITFSISLLIIQRTSSQYSPRVVHTLFRDPFNKRVMALVVATFTYCLVVLRSVRSALDDDGTAVVPNVSVGVAVILGVATILAIVALINHSAHAMDVSEILERVRRDAVDQVRREWSPTTPGRSPVDVIAIGGPVQPVHFDRTGWVQGIDLERLVACLPPATQLRLDAFPGRYAIEGTVLGELHGRCDDIGALEREVGATIGVGDTRTARQDVSYGLRQLADVALRALSPGINDPTTAQDAIFHAAAVLAELLRRDPPSKVRTGEEQRAVVLLQQPTHDDLVRLAFSETRRAAAGNPAVCVYLLEAMSLLAQPLEAAGPGERALPIRDEARLVVAACDHAGVLPADRQLVREAHARRFPADVPVGADDGG